MDPSNNPQKKYETILRRVRDLPSLPDVVSSTMNLLSSPDASASQVAKIISYDPGLTSKFIRMVNSAAYGFQRQISSVQHAIMILGFSTVRGVVLSASIFKLFEGQNHKHNIEPTEFWRHSIGTAIASRIMATKWRIQYADDAFTAGMLHDIGKMILDYYFVADYQKVVQEAKQQNLPTHGLGFLQIEQKVLRIDHAELGYQLACRWKLPATFAEVIRYHHDPKAARDAPELVYVVALANAFINLINLNFGVFNVEHIPDVLLDYFNYDPENPQPFENLFKQICDETEGIDDLLSSLRR
jgi:putative nucleotidyltransferase with HDIG domain